MHLHQLGKASDERVVCGIARAATWTIRIKQSPANGLPPRPLGRALQLALQDRGLRH